MNGVGEAGPEAVLPLKRSVLQEIGDRILSSTSVHLGHKRFNL